MSFELGLNYWPRRLAMYMWREPAMDEVRDEMAHIAAMGFDVVRVFALTQDFLTGPMEVDGRMVDRLVEVVRAAKDARLAVVPTLLVINMSGQIWPGTPIQIGAHLPSLTTINNMRVDNLAAGADAYYRDPATHFARLYSAWLSSVPS